MKKCSLGIRDWALGISTNLGTCGVCVCIHIDGYRW